MRELWKYSFLIHLQQKGQPKKLNLWRKNDIKEITAESQRIGRDLESSAGPAPSQAGLWETIAQETLMNA